MRFNMPCIDDLGQLPLGTYGRTADSYPTFGQQVAQYLQAACHRPLPTARDRSASIPEPRDALNQRMSKAEVLDMIMISTFKVEQCPNVGTI